MMEQHEDVINFCYSLAKLQTLDAAHPVNTLINHPQANHHNYMTYIFIIKP